MQLERITTLSDIPVYQASSAGPHGPERCRTCVAAGSRRVFDDVTCVPGVEAGRYHLFDCGCLMGVSRHIHGLVRDPDGDVVLDSAGNPIPQERKTLALVDSCGWQPRRLCLACTFFQPVEATVKATGRYGEYLQNRSVGGWCTIPPDGVVNDEGRRVLCHFIPRPPQQLASCANCEFCVTPSPNTAWLGLMDHEDVVRVTGAGPYRADVIRRRASGGSRRNRILRDRLDARYAGDEAGLYGSYPATVVRARHRFVSERDRDGRVRFRVEWTSVIIRFASKRLVALGLEDGRTAVSLAMTLDGRALRQPVYPGLIEVDSIGEGRVVVHLALAPYRRWFGLERVKSQAVVSRSHVPGAGFMFVEKASGWELISRDGSAVTAAALAPALPRLRAQARKLGRGATDALARAWAASLDGLPRRPVVEPWSLRPAPGVERGMPVCARFLAGAGGLDLKSELGWRFFGDSMWDTAFQEGRFRKADIVDHWQAMDQGARLAEAVDATLMQADRFDPKTGKTPFHPPVREPAWSEIVLLDSLGHVVDHPEDWTDEDRRADRQAHLEWLAETDEEGVSNRMRRHRYELSRRAAEPELPEGLRDQIGDAYQLGVEMYCEECQATYPSSGTPGSLACPDCGHEGVVADEISDPPGEKGKGITRWRSSDGMIQRAQLAGLVCSDWLLAGSNRSRRRPDGSWSRPYPVTMSDIEEREARKRAALARSKKTGR